MHELKVSATFAAILVAAAAIGVTMGALLMQFQAPGDPATAWRSLVISLAGVGVALCLICLLHLSLATGGLVVRSAQARRVEAWLGRWARVAGGEDPPTVEPSERTAASEAGAQILQDVSGQGAQRIRDAMAAAGLIERDVSLAAGLGGLRQGQRVAALERLAWLAVPQALPLFHAAAGASDPRAARAGLLGACRALGVTMQPGETGRKVLECVEAHAGSASSSDGNRPFLSAALAEAGPHTLWLCTEILRRPLPWTVRAAALEAMGASDAEGTAEAVAQALVSGLEGETLAAGLRALAKLGEVPSAAMKVVAAARFDQHTGVRVQAANALVCAKPAVAAAYLWAMLGDRAFDARLAAAMALTRCGEVGLETLQQAAATHSDAFARDIAAMAYARLEKKANLPEQERGMSLWSSATLARAAG